MLLFPKCAVKEKYADLKREERKVKKSGTSGRIYLPKEWINKQVKIILLEPVADTEEEE